MQRLFLSICTLLSLCSLSSAETWGETNVQFLYGNDFDILIGGDSIPNGEMQTITLEHAGGWAYGKHFFFCDLSSADFASGKKHKVYAEWAPKLDLSKVTKKDISWGIIKETYLAGEINQGDDFRAYNLGIGLGLDLKGFDFFDLNLFHRKDNYNAPTFQITLAWKSHFELLSLPLVFGGFLDYYGNDYGTEIITQPQLLLEGKAFTEQLKELQVGVELYYYKSSASPFHGRINEAVPQIMLKWDW